MITGLLLALVVSGVVAMGGVVPTGLIPVPEEPEIAVELHTSRSTYAPGDYLEIKFSLSHDAYVYLYNVTSAGEVKLLVPNRFLQDPKFAAGEYTLPKEGWRLRVTEPEGTEYLQLVATSEPLGFYDAEAFTEQPFLEFAEPKAFADKLQELVGEPWGTAWRAFSVYRPRAVLRVDSVPPGAEVWVGGQRIGTTPFVGTVDAGRTTVEVRRDGYRTTRRTVDLADGDEAHLAMRLEIAPPPTPPAFRPDVDVPVGVGFTLGVDPAKPGMDGFSLGFEFWTEVLGLGFAIGWPPDRPDVEAPGDGGIFPWSPVFEFYGGGWLSLNDQLGVMLTAGLALQEMVELPPWTPQGVYPAVVIEPETYWEVWPTFGAALGLSDEGWRLHAGWNTERGFTIGLTLTTW